MYGEVWLTLESRDISFLVASSKNRDWPVSQSSHLLQVTIKYFSKFNKSLKHDSFYSQGPNTGHLVNGLLGSISSDLSGFTVGIQLTEMAG